MPCFLIIDSGLETMSLLRMNVDDRWLVCILDRLEHLDQFLQVIAFFQIFVLKSPRLEPVVLALAIAFPKGTKVLVDATMILCN